jgi:hypothetical protein
MAQESPEVGMKKQPGNFAPVDLAVKKSLDCLITTTSSRPARNAKHGGNLSGYCYMA